MGNVSISFYFMATYYAMIVKCVFNHVGCVMLSLIVDVVTGLFNYVSISVSIVATKVGRVVVVDGCAVCDVCCCCGVCV